MIEGQWCFRSIETGHGARVRNNLNHWHQAGLAARLREIREDLYGEDGGQFLADALEIRLQTWLNYESGVVAPAYVVLQLLVMARINPDWLLTGQGAKYDKKKRGTEAEHRGIVSTVDGGDGDPWLDAGD